MPMWSKIAAGLTLAIALLGIVGLKAYSERLGPVIQTHGTTYYNGEGPRAAPVQCKTEGEIVSAIGQVHAKYDRLANDELKNFWQRATELKGLPPMDADTLYVITEDDQLRVGELVLFIGIKRNCVSAVFSFPSRLYRELATSPGPA